MINDHNEPTDNQQPTTEVKPLLYYAPSQNGQYFAQILPHYVQYFQKLLQMIQQLQSTINSKWNPEQVQCYLTFLLALKNYVNQFVFTCQVPTFNEYQQAMESYGKNENPIGFELYKHQVDYIVKKAGGYSWKGKKQEKKQNIQEVKIKEKKVERVKQEEIKRKEDPKVSASELKAKRQWSSEKYGNLKDFYKQNINLVFIGHVDSGKSTLTGNIIKELREADEQELTRNKKQSQENHMEAWQIAYLSDIDPNERLRGKTIECSKLTFSTQLRRYTIFDAPGHQNYVPNMIIGACQADVAILIISARVGQFQAGFNKSGQTKEHALIATALGVKQLIVAVTKMETVDWSEERYKQIKEKVEPFLNLSCGFNNVKFVPIDSLSNKNIHFLSEGNWYKGSYLIQALDQAQFLNQNSDGPLRLPIVSKYRDREGFFLEGKIESGKIAFEGQEVTILPQRRYIKILQILNSKDEKLPYALAGENIKIKVRGIEKDEVERGNIICSNMDYAQESMQFKAKFTVTHLPGKKVLSAGYKCILHLNAICEEAQIQDIESKVEQKSQKGIKTTILKMGETGQVIIQLKRPICMQKFDYMPKLGRFTLRSQGNTIGYGFITKIKPANKLTKEQKEHLKNKAEKKQSQKKE